LLGTLSKLRRARRLFAPLVLLRPFLLVLAILLAYGLGNGEHWGLHGVFDKHLDTRCLAVLRSPRVDTRAIEF
jgi:hypothetical protein